MFHNTSLQLFVSQLYLNNSEPILFHINDGMIPVKMNSIINEIMMPFIQTLAHKHHHDFCF